MKRILFFSLDILMAVVAVLAALVLRYGHMQLPPWNALLLVAAVFGAIAAISYRIFGLERGMWRYTSIVDLRAIVMAVTLTVAGFLVAMFMINRLSFVPRSVPIISWFILIVLLGLSRVASRIIWEGGLRNFSLLLLNRPTRANGIGMIVGTPAQSERVVRALGYDSAHLRSEKVGIIDLNVGTAGMRVRGVPILGSFKDIDEIIRRQKQIGCPPTSLILASLDVDQSVLRKASTLAAEEGVPVRRISDGAPEKGEPVQLRAVTLEELLGRPPVSLDLTSVEQLIEGKVVLITGAGGSIGSEIARQAAKFSPRQLVLIDHSEFNLFQIDGELSKLAPGIDRLAIIASVQDRNRVSRIFSDCQPEIVFHAAALKHVPMVEANPCEGILTNVGGTRNVADAATAVGARAVVLISTDKAVKPSSVMGASKKVAEAYCQALDSPASYTRFIIARFGNVLGSTGSVVPIFEEQIRGGGPVTVTHAEMKRFFMSIREATELVLQAAAHGLAHPEEAGCIHVLDMGEPVRIIDLARTMIALAGLKPDEDIPISIVGIRPGEKLAEEYFDADEKSATIALPGVLLATTKSVDREKLRDMLEALLSAAEKGEVADVSTILSALVADPPGDRIGAPLSSTKTVASRLSQSASAA